MLRNPLSINGSAIAALHVAALAVVLTVGAAGPAAAEAGVVLDRPTFDRDNNVILIPFRGPVPRMETESKDGGTRLIAEFSGSQATMSTPYKLGIFHPLVSKVEMTPLQDQARVRVSIALSQPSRMTIVPDARRGVLRLQLGKVDPSMLPQPPQPSLVGFGSGPSLPQAAPALPPPRVESYPGQAVLSPRPPAFAPAVSPSLPPVKWGGTNPLPGTPASGEYVYRKAIPSENGRDVTEIQVRTPRRSAIDIQNNIQNDAVNVAVSPPGGVMAAAAPGAIPEGWTRPLPNEPWKLPGYRGEPVFRPVAAIDAILGYTLMSESARTLGTRFDGAGSTLMGLTGHVPLGTNWNMNLAAETFGYTIASLQVPDAQTRRDEYFGSFSLEYLPIRRPWVLAVGLGYWGRYVTQKNNILAPPEASLLFAPTQLWHGPALGLRGWVPIWRALGFSGELGAAPYMWGGSDPTAAAIGNIYGFQGLAGLKWSQRHFSVSAGYRHQGYNSFNSAFTFNRGGPEVQLVWRF
jgi:hypothetical protein